MISWGRNYFIVDVQHFIIWILFLIYNFLLYIFIIYANITLFYYMVTELVLKWVLKNLIMQQDFNISTLFLDITNNTLFFFISLNLIG